MSFQNQANLVTDQEFQSRCSACVFTQAQTFKDDGRQDIAALAKRHLQVPTEIPVIWAAFMAASPGFADQTDPAAITDGDILSSVQANWPTVASVHYNPDGTHR